MQEVANIITLNKRLRELLRYGLVQHHLPIVSAAGIFHQKNARVLGGVVVK